MTQNNTNVLSSPFVRRRGNTFLSFFTFSLFLSLFFFTPEANATCYVNMPSLSQSNGCAEASSAPTSSYGGSVEFMWAKNNNGSITPVTGWSTSTSLTYCPSNSGYYRLCARKVGCSTIYESYDVYVDPGDNGDGGDENCYKIKTKACNKILDVSGGSTSNGATLVQWSNNDQLNQRFQFDHLGNGVYRIIAVHSGKVLQAQNGGTANGTKVVQGTWNGWNSQKWILYNAGYGFYFIKNKKSGTYMDFYGNCGNGDKIELWCYYGDSYQKFKLIEKDDCSEEEECDGEIISVKINDLDGGSDIDLANGASFNLSDLPANWNLEAFKSGSIESIKIKVSGDASGSKCESYSPFRYPSDNTSANFGPGTYTVKAKGYDENSCNGELCDELIITFTIVDEDPICEELFNGGLIGVGPDGVLSMDEVCSSCADAANAPVIIINSSSPDAGGAALEHVWIKKAGTDCSTDDLAPFNVGEIYNAFLANGGYGSADAQIGNTGWMFVTDFDGDDLNLSLDCVEETACFRRCSRIVDCVRFNGESNAVTIKVNDVEGGQIGLLAGGAPVLTSTAICSGDAVPVIANGVSPSAAGGVENVWLRTVADGTPANEKVAALAAVNVGQLYDNYVAGGMTSPFVFIPNSNVVWEFIADGDANDEELALSSLDQSYHFMRCVRAIGDVRFCGESIPMPVTIYVEDCAPAVTNPCTWERCNGVVTISGTDATGINSVKVLDADDNALPSVFECGTYLAMQCTDPIEVTLPNPTGNYIVSIICDDGNHYDYINNDCGSGALVRANDSDVTGSARLEENETGSVEDDFDRERPVMQTEQLREFEVFPNPATNEVFVGLNAFAGRAAQISVLNSLGQLMQTQAIDALPEGKVRLDISNLSTGVYFVRMQVEGAEELTKRLIVNQNR